MAALEDVRALVLMNEDGVESFHRYNTYGEHDCPSEDRTKPDSCTIYRGIARQVIGDPRLYKKVRDHVQRFAIRAGLPDHKMHDKFVIREMAFLDKERRPLFTGLECPDLSPNEHLFWVIARALKVRIKVYSSVCRGKIGRILVEAGQPGLPICRLVKSRKGFASLIQDQSGRSLVEYLQEQQKSSKQDPNALQMKHIGWTWERSEYCYLANLACYNGHKPESRASDLDADAELNRMDVFSVVISNPLQIKPAIQLLKQVLLRAPYQCCTTRSCSGRQQIARAHIGIDLEFVKMPLGRASSSRNVQQDLENGDLDEIVSVMSIAVGRHFSLMINIADMLEHANEHTVEALGTLYREIVFNAELVKLWWNPQRDFEVLDTTIGYMYQGTCKDVEIRRRLPNCDETPMTRPRRFHIKNQHLGGIRPDDLKEYTKLTECELHTGWQYPEAVSRYHAGCPCSLGNIDLAALLDFFCSQHGIGSSKQYWTTVRRNFRYGDLLSTMLGHSRLAPLLEYLKDCGRGDAFYQSLGLPGMERDDLAMGYNIGDVVGINLVYEQLMACQDKRSTAYRLCLYRLYSNNDRHYANFDWLFDEQPTPGSRAERLMGQCGGVPLYDDNPRSYNLEPFSALNKKDKLVEKFTRPGVNARSGPKEPAHLLFWEHDQHAIVMREVSGKLRPTPKQKILYQSQEFPSTRDSVWSARNGLLMQEFLRHIVDPTRLALPESMLAPRPHEEYEEPIVRSGSTHTEALVEFLKAPRFAGVGSPLGFAASPGSTYGLPRSVARTPGQDMQGGRAIFAAFTSHPTGAGADLLKADSTVAGLGGAPSQPALRIDEEGILQMELDATGVQDDCWRAASIAMAGAERAVKSEQAGINQEGLPYLLDEGDVYDPEGRHYRKLAEAAEPWNRPLLFDYYHTGPDGEWLSSATVRLGVLLQKLPAEITRSKKEEVRDAWGDLQEVDRNRDDDWTTVIARKRR